MSLTEKLADFIEETTFSSLPSNVIKTAKLCLLDFLGCVYGGSREKSGKIVLDLVRKLGGNKEATIIATGEKVPCLHAALVNGTMGHSLEFDDLHREGGAHPGVTVIPAALAAAELEERTGKELLTAIIVGYEINVRLGAIVSFEREHEMLRPHGVHVSSLMGTFGAAAAAAKLLKLSSEEIANALGICALAPISPFEVTVGGGMVKDTYGGWPAQTGLFAALLAKMGFTGSKRILESMPLGIYNIVLRRDVDFFQALSRLGESWAITSTTFKPYACCRFSHSTIDAILDAIKQKDLNPSDIKDVIITTHARGYHIGRTREPSDVVQARFSIPFVAAMTLIKKRGVNIDDITEETIKDEKVLELSRKVKCVHDPYLDSLASKGYRVSVVKITTTKGETYEGRCDIPKGDPRNPLTEGELLSKFKGLASMLLSPAHIEQVIHVTRNIEAIDNIRDYTRILPPTGESKNP
jgi:2-methylcitrate dehydratase PrpD